MYSLDFIPDLPAEADAEMLEKAIAGHILEEYDLTGIYAR